MIITTATKTNSPYKRKQPFLNSAPPPFPLAEITTTPQPEVTTTLPPPPACTPCPGLPEEFYDRCASCSSGRFFDGKACVPKAVCPCYKDGNRCERRIC